MIVRLTCYSVGIVRLEINTGSYTRSQHYLKYAPPNTTQTVHVAHTGPTWVLSAPGWSHVGLMNLAIRVCLECMRYKVY